MPRNMQLLTSVPSPSLLHPFVGSMVWNIQIWQTNTVSNHWHCLTISYHSFGCPFHPFNSESNWPQCGLNDGRLVPVATLATVPPVPAVVPGVPALASGGGPPAKALHRGVSYLSADPPPKAPLPISHSFSTLLPLSLSDITPLSNLRTRFCRNVFLN